MHVKPCISYNNIHWYNICFNLFVKIIKLYDNNKIIQLKIDIWAYNCIAVKLYIGYWTIKKGRSSMDEKIKMEELTSSIWQGFYNLAIAFFTASS